MAKRENRHKNRTKRGCIVGQVCCRSNSKAGNVWKKKKGKKGWSSGNRWKVCDEGGECAFIGMRSDEFPLGHFINAEPTKLSIAKPLPRQTLSTTSRFSSINAKALEPSIPPASIRAPALHTTSRKFDSRHDRLTPRLSIMHTRMRGT